MRINIPTPNGFRGLRNLIALINANFVELYGGAGGEGGGYNGNPTTIQQDATHRFTTDAEKTTWTGKAAGNHNHNGVYSAIDHNHDSTYAPVVHTHDYAATSHNHAGVYSVVNHDHAGVYSPVAHNHDASYSAVAHTHAGTYEPASASIQSHVGSTSNPHSTTKAQVGLTNVDNTADSSKPVSTAQQTALDLKTDLSVLNTLLSSYHTLLQASGSHIAGKTAGTYALGAGDVAAVSGTGTLYPLSTIFIAAADYPTVNGKAPKLRIRSQLYTNDVAPTGNFTFGLYPITRPGTSGSTGVNIFTIGSVVAGSNGASFTTPAADGLLSAVSADFALPSDGHYVIAVVTTGTIATSAHVHLVASLQIHNA